MPLNLTINKLRFPNNGSINDPISVTLSYKEFYATSFITIGSGINVGVDGTVLDSPLPVIAIDPSLKYVLKAVNDQCGFEYYQDVIINAYCPIGYELSLDSTYCLLEETIQAISPTSPENTVAVGDSFYGDCGTYIYDLGYNFNGTGISNQITVANAFWKNGSGTCVADGNTNDGPLNRSGLWATTSISDQDVGFSVCIDISIEKTYYFGFGCDNYGILRIDGETIIQQNEAALDAQYGIAGAPFHVWHIYPVTLTAGQHVIELIGHNVISPAGMGAEIYDNTSAEIISATSYGMLNLLFSTKDYIGTPVQIGTDGIGYTCPIGYSLAYCESPIVCKRTLITPVLY
jgi:hypothetical protein